MKIRVKTTFQGFFRWCLEPLICRAFGKANVLWTSTTQSWSREPLMCSTLMFGTLKLGLIDLQSAPQNEGPMRVGFIHWKRADTISKNDHDCAQSWSVLHICTFVGPFAKFRRPSRFSTNEKCALLLKESSLVWFFAHFILSRTKIKC